MLELAIGADRKRFADKLYYYKNRERISQQSRAKYAENSESIKSRVRSRYEKEKDSINKERRKRLKDRMANDLQFAEKERQRLREYKEKNRAHVNEKSKKWQKENSERRKEIQKNYREKNKEKIRKYVSTDEYKARQAVWSDQWRKKNEDKYRLHRKRWFAENYEYVLWYNKQRSKKIKQACIGKSMFWKEIGSMYMECRKMNKDAGFVKYHVDHQVPLKNDSVCGLHVPWNLRIIPAEENIKKSNKLDLNLIMP